MFILFDIALHLVRICFISIGHFVSCMFGASTCLEDLCQQELDLIHAGLQKEQVNDIRRYAYSTGLPTQSIYASSEHFEIGFVT